MFKNSEQKIDYDTDVVRGFVWAEDWNILTDQFDKIIEVGEDENMDRAIKNITSIKLEVINESLIRSDIDFNMGVFKAKGDTIGRLYLSIGNSFKEIKTSNGKSITKGFIKDGEKVAIYRSFDGSYYTTIHTIELPPLINLYNSKIVVGDTCVIIPEEDTIKGNLTFTEWVKDMQIVFDTTYGPQTVILNDWPEIGNENKIIYKQKVGSKYYVYSKTDLRIIMFRYNINSPFVNGGNGLVYSEYNGYIPPTIRNINIERDEVDSTNLRDTLLSKNATQYVDESDSKLLLTHTLERSSIVGKEGMLWTTDLKTLENTYIIKDGDNLIESQDIVDRYNNISYSDMIPNNGDPTEDYNIGYATSENEAVSRKKLEDMGLLNRNNTYVKLTGVPTEDVRNRGLSISVKPYRAFGETWTHGITYECLSPAPCWLGYRLKSEMLYRSSPVVFCMGDLYKGTNQAIRLGRKRVTSGVTKYPIEVLATSGLQAGGESFEGTNYVKFGDAVFDYLGTSLQSWGTKPPELVDAVHGPIDYQIPSTEGEISGGQVVPTSKHWVGESETAYIASIVGDADTYVIGSNKMNWGGYPNADLNQFVREGGAGNAKIIKYSEYPEVYLTEDGALFVKRGGVWKLAIEKKVVWFSITGYSTRFDNMAIVISNGSLYTAKSATSATRYSNFQYITDVSNVPPGHRDNVILCLNGVVFAPYGSSNFRAWNASTGSVVQYIPKGINSNDFTSWDFKPVNEDYVGQYHKIDHINYTYSLVYGGVSSYNTVDYSFFGLSYYDIFINDMISLGDLHFIAYMDYAGDGLYHIMMKGTDTYWYTNTSYHFGVEFGVAPVSSGGYHFSSVNNGEIIIIKSKSKIYYLKRGSYASSAKPIMSAQSELTQNDVLGIQEPFLTYYAGLVNNIHVTEELVRVLTTTSSLYSSYTAGDRGTLNIPKLVGFDGIVHKTGVDKGIIFFNYSGRTYSFNTKNKTNLLQPQIPTSTTSFGTITPTNFIGITHDMVLMVKISEVDPEKTPVFDFESGPRYATNPFLINDTHGTTYFFDKTYGNYHMTKDIGHASDCHWIAHNIYAIITDGKVGYEGYGSTTYKELSPSSSAKALFIIHGPSTSTVVYFLASDMQIYYIGTTTLPTTSSPGTYLGKLDTGIHTTTNGWLSIVKGISERIILGYGDSLMDLHKVGASGVIPCAGDFTSVGGGFSGNAVSIDGSFYGYRKNDLTKTIKWDGSLLTSSGLYLNMKACGQTIISYTAGVNAAKCAGIETMGHNTDSISHSTPSTWYMVGAYKPVKIFVSSMHSEATVAIVSNGGTYISGKFPTGSTGSFTYNQAGKYMNDISGSGLQSVKPVNNSVVIRYTNGVYRLPTPAGVKQAPSVTIDKKIEVSTAIGVFRLTPNGYAPSKQTTMLTPADNGVIGPDGAEVDDDYVWYVVYPGTTPRNGGMKVDGTFVYFDSTGKREYPNAWHYRISNLVYSATNVVVVADGELYVLNSDDALTLLPLSSFVIGAKFNIDGTLSVSTEHGNGIVDFGSKTITNLYTEIQYGNVNRYKRVLGYGSVNFTVNILDGWTINLDANKIHV